MRVRRTVWVFLMGLVLCGTDAYGRVLLLASDDSPLYDAFRQGFSAALGDVSVQHGVRYVLASNYRPELAPAPGEVVIAAGVAAAERLADAALDDVRVIYTLLPLSSYHWLRDKGSLQPDHQVIVIDQPARRFVNLVQVALPGVRSLAFLHGEVSAEHAPALSAAAAALGIGMESYPLHTTRRLASLLRSAIAGSDVALVLPDPYLFNRRAVQAVLLASLRGGKPLIAYSESYIEAGALLALFSSPQQLGRQSAELVNCYDTDCPMTRQQLFHPRYFSVQSNALIARRLGLSLPSEREIELQLQAREPR